MLELTASGVVAADASTSVTAAELQLVGRIKVVGDADLQLRRSRSTTFSITGCDVDDGLLQTCKQAGFAFDSSSANDGGWAVRPMTSHQRGSCILTKIATSFFGKI